MIVFCFVKTFYVFSVVAFFLCHFFYLANGKDVFWAFMDLDKAYDTIDRHGLWLMLRVYGVGGKLLKAVQSFYVDTRACVRVGNDVSEWFPVNVGLRQAV